MTGKSKDFDAVEMMRSIRDNLTRQMKGMTAEEQREWLASRDLQDPFLQRLRERARRQNDESAAVDHRG